MRPIIPLMKVFMPPPEELMPELQKTLYSGTVSEGEKVKEFEEKLQKYLGCSSRPLSVNSGTSALQLAYRCAEVKNKIVLSSPMTCTATNMPILQEGGQIVWCDIDPNTGNISADSVKRNLDKYGDRVCAVSFVDFAGYPADVNALIDLKNQYGIKLIEDAAQSFGAFHYIRDDNYCFLVANMVGSVEEVDYCAFSFQAIKHLTTVDGGALICNDKAKWDVAKKLKWYGINREAVKDATRWHYDIVECGYKMHMNNVNATIGISQLNHVGSIVSAHVSNGIYLSYALQDVADLKTMTQTGRGTPSYWIYMVKVERREDFAKMMKDANITVNVAHIRNDGYTCFKKDDQILNVGEELPGLQEFNDQYIAIPCGWWVTPEDREYIVETIKRGW
jgi:dTDP-4-amino-4,6-dideoxygalactose transaminase